jgi:thiol-disulfide isomerase/thioredoxin
VTRSFGDRARFVSENYGESELARRFGVTRYPAIFVEDVLVATPDDFGFYGGGRTAGGRYAPLKSAESHERFRSDLGKMIELVLAGRKEVARGRAAPATPAAARPGTRPALRMTDLAGRHLVDADFAGRVVLVEFWATWCPPCRGTLRWLGDLQRRYGDRLAVVAIAVESEERAVRKVVDELKLPGVSWVMGTPELARSFGDISAVPQMLVFDREARTAVTYFGAPPDLHAKAEATISSLMN